MAADFIAYVACMSAGAFVGIWLGRAFCHWYWHGDKSTT